MHLQIDGEIKISNADQKTLNAIKSYLTIENPQYMMALNMVKNDPTKRTMLYAMKQSFSYYKEENGILTVGRGLAEKLVKYFNANNIKFTYNIDRVSNLMDEPLDEKIELRPYQVGVSTKVLESKQGVLKLGTAFGKTIIAFRLAEKTKLKTLIICCKSESTELSKYRSDFKKIYGRKIGIIQGKNFDIKDVTVATASTLTRRNLDTIKNNFGMVIVDEVHVGMSKKRLEAFQKFNPEIFYGMSGTPGRANGQGAALSFYYGDIIIEKKLPQEKPDIHIYRTNVEIEGDEFYEMEAEVVVNSSRNNLIVRAVLSLLSSKRRILILTKRIDHGKILKELINDALGIHEMKIHAMSSNDPASTRSELIEALRSEDKDFNVLIGTYGLFSTGVDIPLIDTGMLAMSIKVDGDYDATLVQSIGRSLRLHDEKQKPLIIDFDDNCNKIMHRHFGTRLKSYRDNGFNVEYKN